MQTEVDQVTTENSGLLAYAIVFALVAVAYAAISALRRKEQGDFHKVNNTASCIPFSKRFTEDNVVVKDGFEKLT